MTGIKIGHIAMYVNDLEKMKQFFTVYLGAEADGGYHNPVSGLRTYFLTFSDGARLELMNRPDMADTAKHDRRTGYAHVAFNLGSREKVDELTEKLRNDGFNVVSGPRVTGDGYYESCIAGPEGDLIELTV